MTDTRVFGLSLAIDVGSQVVAPHAGLFRNEANVLQRNPVPIEDSLTTDLEGFGQSRRISKRLEDFDENGIVCFFHVDVEAIMALRVNRRLTRGIDELTDWWSSEDGSSYENQH